MTRIRHAALTLAVTFLALLMSAQAQTPTTIEVTSDSYRAQFTVQGEGQEVRVEVYAPSGEMVYDSGATTGQAVEWRMQAQNGRRVADGVYLATITVKTASGQTRKRIEQIIVNHEQPSTAPAPAAPSAASATITGSGTGTATSGSIARFTDASTIGNSVMTQSATRSIGINANPTAMLHVHELPLATSSVANGANAVTLLQTSGGKGGNTTAAGKTGGKGASISLLAGNGGNAVGGATNGSGGSITLQPGSAGTGGSGGSAGDVLLAASAGNVAIGTATPKAKLHVVGGDLLSGAAGEEWIFHTRYHVGGDFLHITDLDNGVPQFQRGLVLHQKGFVGIGTINPTRPLDIQGTTTNIANQGYQEVLKVKTNSNTYGRAIYGQAESGDGLYGDGKRGVVGYGSSTGVWGHSPLGYAGEFVGKVKISKGLEITNGGCTGCNPPSDRNLKANFSAVNPRFILDRLATLPIQSWNYKSEDTTTRHIGPMAQDFRAAFNLGVDDKTLNTVDAQGVTMAAIQGLYQQNQELTRKVEHLQSQVTKLQRTVKQQRTFRNKGMARKN